MRIGRCQQGTIPKNPHCRAHDVYELNRLWMHDNMPKNSESRFVGWCLRELRKLRPKLILVSYADTKRSNTGQGFIKPRIGFIREPRCPGGISVLKDFRTTAACPKHYVAKRLDESIRALDPSIPRVPRSTKHRYVWFSDSGDRSLFTWEVLPYPKSCWIRPPVLPASWCQRWKEALQII